VNIGKLGIVTRFSNRDTILAGREHVFQMFKLWHDLWIRFVYLGSYTMYRDMILAIVTRFW